MKKQLLALSFSTVVGLGFIGGSSIALADYLEPTPVAPMDVTLNVVSPATYKLSLPASYVIDATKLQDSLSVGDLAASGNLAPGSKLKLELKSFELKNEAGDSLPFTLTIGEKNFDSQGGSFELDAEKLWLSYLADSANKVKPEDLDAAGLEAKALTLPISIQLDPAVYKKAPAGTYKATVELVGTIEDDITNSDAAKPQSFKLAISYTSPNTPTPTPESPSKDASKVQSKANLPKTSDAASLSTAAALAVTAAASFGLRRLIKKQN